MVGRKTQSTFVKKKKLPINIEMMLFQELEQFAIASKSTDNVVWPRILTSMSSYLDLCVSSIEMLPIASVHDYKSRTRTVRKYLGEMESWAIHTVWLSIMIWVKYNAIVSIEYSLEFLSTHLIIIKYKQQE